MVRPTRRAIENVLRTISTRTSPAANDSPSCFFHDAMPPSVIVGDMAGMANLVVARLVAEVWIPLANQYFFALVLR
jgi:hypothetical protein